MNNENITEKNKEELISIYESIPEGKKQSFLKSVEYLRDIYLDQ